MRKFSSYGYVDKVFHFYVPRTEIDLLIYHNNKLYGIELKWFTDLIEIEKYNVFDKKDVDEFIDKFILKKVKSKVIFIIRKTLNQISLSIIMS